MVAGSLLFAIFLVLAWGALHDSARADGAPAAPVGPAAVSATPAASTPAAATPASRHAQAKRQPTGGTPPPAPGAPNTNPAPVKAAQATKVVKLQTSASAATWRAGGLKRPRAIVVLAATAGGAPTAALPAPATNPTVAAALASPTAAAALVPHTSPAKAVLLAASGVKVKGGGGAGGTATTALVAPPVVNQCNGIGNGGGQAVACTVTVINNLDLATGLGTSSVTVNQCQGAANAPLTCVASTTISNQVVQAVTQCNGSGSGGGGTVTCGVDVINNIFGVATTSPATVNQCNGSGQGGGANPVTCSPAGATTDATVTQCNGSGNGGGGPGRVQCTVAPVPTQTSVLPVTVNQCNDSANGGGATVTCTTSVTTNLFPGSSLPPSGGTGGPAVPPVGGAPITAPPGRGPPGRVTAVSLRQGTATALFMPTGRATPPAALGRLARTGVDSRTMALVALLAIVAGALLVGLSRRRPGVRTATA